ncbi:MAG: F0F1 ATP synthase subunit delta, partial [Chitinophagaceae bacterium]
MTNPRLAIRYAKSLLDLAQEQGKLEDAFNDMKLLDTICKSSREF